jgi:hypothetical protein
VSTAPFARAALILALLGAPARPDGAERPPRPVAEPEPGPGQPGPLTGACYLTFGERQDCIADTSESDCRRRCDDLLCDSYAWRDRLPCWNWGYGG